MKKWLLIGSLLAALGLAGVAVAQLPNTLNVSSAPSGTAPAIRAAGIDANVSINLIPKGSGTVQVNGAPVAIGGGTITSLTINPGPLAVTGTTNLTGPLNIQTGTAAGLKLVGARIFHSTTDVATTGTVIETLYTFSVPANTLAVDGQSLRLYAVATTAANGNAKTFSIDYGATTIFTSSSQAYNNDYLAVSCEIFRTGAATQKAFCKMEGSELNAFTAGISVASNLTTPAETLSGAVTILVRGTTPTAAADLTARLATVDWYPVGQ